MVRPVNEPWEATALPRYRQVSAESFRVASRSRQVIFLQLPVLGVMQIQLFG